MNSENPFDSLDEQTIKELIVGIEKNFCTAYKTDKNGHLTEKMYDYSKHLFLFAKLVNWTYIHQSQIKEKYNPTTGFSEKEKLQREFSTRGIVYRILESKLKNNE